MAPRNVRLDRPNVRQTRLPRYQPDGCQHVAARMKGSILFLAPSAYPLGGVADWLDYLLPGLERNGWRCTLGLTTGRYHDADAYLAVHPWHRVNHVSCATGS